MLIYLNEVGKQLITQSLALERRVPQVSSQQRHDSLNKLKPYLTAEGLAGRSLCFFLLPWMYVKKIIKWIFQKSSAFMLHHFVTEPDLLSIISGPHMSVNQSDPDRSFTTLSAHVIIFEHPTPNSSTQRVFSLYVWITMPLHLSDNFIGSDILQFLLFCFKSCLSIFQWCVTLVNNTSYSVGFFLLHVLTCLT